MATLCARESEPRVDGSAVAPIFQSSTFMWNGELGYDAVRCEWPADGAGLDSAAVAAAASGAAAVTGLQQGAWAACDAPLRLTERGTHPRSAQQRADPPGQAACRHQVQQQPHPADVGTQAGAAGGGGGGAATGQRHGRHHHRPADGPRGGRPLPRAKGALRRDARVRRPRLLMHHTFARAAGVAAPAACPLVGSVNRPSEGRGAWGGGGGRRTLDGDLTPSPPLPPPSGQSGAQGPAGTGHHQHRHRHSGSGQLGGSCAAQHQGGGARSPPRPQPTPPAAPQRAPAHPCGMPPDTPHAGARVTAFWVQAIYVEAASNPLLEVPELEAVVAFARRHGLVSMIDATFASPINLRPLALGFDVVLHRCGDCSWAGKGGGGGAPALLGFEAVLHRCGTQQGGRHAAGRGRY